MTPSTPCLNVIALISGGKDSMYTIAHCIANGHRVVALANLSPPLPQAIISPTSTQAESSEKSSSPREANPPSSTEKATVRSPVITNVPESVDSAEGAEEQDLNSFMFQTAGHSLIPLYDGCVYDSGEPIPLYRRVISGSAVMMAKEYDPVAVSKSAGEAIDETEDMFLLLQDIKAAHTEANSVCAGAILSTYQRTRVESVALRLGLAPLAWLWMYPSLPRPGSPPATGIQSLQSTTVSKVGATEGNVRVRGDDHDVTALLRHMAAVGTDSRIIKVASAGLDESFLWLNVCDERTIKRLQKAMTMFGGSVLGEGGEFETLTVSGPPRIWKKRLQVDEVQRKVVKGEGGEIWLSFTGGQLAEVTEEVDNNVDVLDKPAIPGLFDEKFEDMLFQFNELFGTLPRLVPQNREQKSSVTDENQSRSDQDDLSSSTCLTPNAISMSNIAGAGTTSPIPATIVKQTTEICRHITEQLSRHGLGPASLVHVIVLLRRMSDFAAFNAVYSSILTVPLPPSRVTVSCGAELPDGVDVLLSLKASRTDEPASQRKGLHVQSRSYWAPANIGPYSQARPMPINMSQGVFRARAKEHEERNEDGSTSDLSTVPEASLVYIAGQIPLVPSSMEMLRLEDLSTDSRTETSNLSLRLFQARAVLALQHLWRIGQEQEVGLWSGGVAYLSATSSQQEFRSKVKIVYQVWAAAHTRMKIKSEDSEDSEDDIDLWDRRQMQPSWMAGIGTQSASDRDKHLELPDWDRIDVADMSGGINDMNKTHTDADGDGNAAPHPGFLAVEVDDLPRSAEVEWQSHGFRAASGNTKVRFKLATPECAPVVNTEQVITWPPELPVWTTELRSTVGGLHGEDMGETVHARVTIIELHEKMEAKQEVRQESTNTDDVKRVKAVVQEKINKEKAHAIVYATRGLSCSWGQGITVVPCLRVAGSNGRDLIAGVVVFEGC